MNEETFLKQVEDNVCHLTCQLSDSPNSLTRALEYQQGYLAGFCNAQGWQSDGRSILFRKIQNTIEVVSR